MLKGTLKLCRTVRIETAQSAEGDVAALLVKLGFAVENELFAA